MSHIIRPGDETPAVDPALQQQCDQLVATNGALLARMKLLMDQRDSAIVRERDASAVIRSMSAECDALAAWEVCDCQMHRDDYALKAKNRKRLVAEWCAAHPAGVRQ